MTETASASIKLGLIGDNIARSKSPRLHRTAGTLTGNVVTYDRLIPKDMGLTFDEVFDQAENSGFRGINVTYPYKELVTSKVRVDDPLVRAIGAVNTVVFAPDGPKGFNTDYSGFMRAYRTVRGSDGPGTVCLIGTGGVGKAVAFGLIGLEAEVIRCVDLDPDKAGALADALRALGSKTRIETSGDAVAAARGADGIINCTPLGMVGIGGSALPGDAMQGAVWAVTSEAVQARDQDEGRVDAYVQQCLDKFHGFKIPVFGAKKRMEAGQAMRNFYRDPGTNLYRNMTDGTDSYRVVAFQKSAD